jgi:hypothetical protein
MNYPLRCDDPTALDIVCDDQVVLTLQYSTQWDSLSHVGQMFDADGDGVAEDVFYNGYRAVPTSSARSCTTRRVTRRRRTRPPALAAWASRTWRLHASRAAPS